MKETNTGLLGAVQQVLTESESDYAPKYDAGAGAYHVEHKPSGRIVAYNVATSGGAAISHAAAFNADPSKDKVANPTEDHLVDHAMSHANLHAALHLVNNSPFHDYAASKALKDAVSKSAEHLDMVHKNFAANNPNHDLASKSGLAKRVHFAHGNQLGDMSSELSHLPH